ncbi:hypothetical protein GGR88_000228 [Sphingomonas jejuensis]|uniref:DUF4398 domain-containing protein n=1 Tax=Sphingomonas jejuensis TaxID=904715 RepID=A0ABX0XIT2_9SPHN|nr:hypothetical protein [Sphingomonas jejuensis]NJC32754.1 hypothetical protein [Sphingomonas jejuensis]
MLRPLLPALLLLSGCAARDDGAFPSLGIRAVESRSDAITTPPATPPAPADAALRTRIDSIRADVDAGRRDFDQAFPGASRTIRAGHGTASGSERWVAAQAALSALEASRAAASAALAATDSLLADRIAAGETAGTDELLALRGDAQRVVDDQAARIAPLRAGLSA